MEPTPITVPLCWGHGLDLNILYKRESGFCRLDVFYWWAQFILRCPGNSAEEPFWDLFSSLGVWVMTNPKFYSPWKIPFTVVILFILFLIQGMVGHPFYSVVGYSYFHFILDCVGLGFTYSLSSLGIWVWPIESYCSHLLGDYAFSCWARVYEKTGINTVIFMNKKFSYELRLFEVLYRNINQCYCKRLRCLKFSLEKVEYLNIMVKNLEIILENEKSPKIEIGRCIKQ